VNWDRRLILDALDSNLLPPTEFMSRDISKIIQVEKGEVVSSKTVGKYLPSLIRLHNYPYVRERDNNTKTYVFRLKSNNVYAQL